MNRRTLTEVERTRILFQAKEYVDKQLATMEKFGSKPDLTKKGYRHLIGLVVKPAIELAECQRGVGND